MKFVAKHLEKKRLNINTIERNNVSYSLYRYYESYSKNKPTPTLAASVEPSFGTISSWNNTKIKSD